MRDEFGRDAIRKEGTGWLVADKAAGFESIVTGGGDPRLCYATRLRRALGIPFLAPCHRLDRDTTGCLLCATERERVKGLEELFRTSAAEKAYLALALGAPRNRTGTIRRPLTEWGGGRRPVRTVKGRGGLEAVTVYELLGTADAGELRVGFLLFRPRTGRTHQIRVHAAALGHPLLGDDQYGDREANRTVAHRWGLARQALHAWRLSFTEPESGEAVSADAPLPEDLGKLLDAVLPAWRGLLSHSKD